MEEKPHEHKKLLAVGVVAVVAVIISIATAIALLIISNSTKPTERAIPKNNAAALFYDTLANASRQQLLRVAMYRATYATKAEADSRQNIGTETSSIAEVDVPQGKSRAVYATSTVRAPEFDLGRCMDGTEYLDNYFVTKQPYPNSLAAAADALKTGEHLFRVTENLTFVVCPTLGLLPGAATDLAAFRLSDGVFPVTLSDTQAESWKNKMKAADLFIIKDEGLVEHNGKQVRKLSFTPAAEDGINKKLYDIFYQTGEIDKIKQEHPEAHWQYEFLSVNPANTGSVSGFYLIDEATKLPVYSEIKSINKDKEADKGIRNIARVKQTYSFGKPLSLTLDSQLELRE